MEIPKICPVCETNKVIRHRFVWGVGETGIWQEIKSFDNLEDGDYTCENDHCFHVEYNEVLERFEINEL